MEEKFVKIEAQIVLVGNWLEFWNMVVESFHEEEILDNSGYESLKEFLEIAEVQLMLGEQIFFAEKGQQMLHQLQEMHEKNEQAYEERFRYIFEPQQVLGDYGEIWKERMVNPDKYIPYFFKASMKYVILHKIFEEKMESLSESFEKNIYYKKYEKDDSYGYYYPSPIIDIIISNYSRGKLYKRVPKSLETKFEYNFDSAGRLIMTRRYDEEKRIWSVKFLLYSEDYVFGVDFYKSMDPEKKSDVSSFDINRYEGDKICWFESASICSMYTPSSIENESYEYSRGILENCCRESYSFNTRIRIPDLLSINHYLFHADEEGRIKGFDVAEYWGDNKFKSNYVEHPERQRPGTEKDAPRWKRPNYFNEE